MIKDPKSMSDFEDEQIRADPADYASALKLFEAMWKEAVSLGVLPLKDPLEGIEVDIRMARMLNRV